MDRLEIAKGVEATRDFALLLRDERALVISDLHLGFEGALAEQGVSIPLFQRRVILERLGQMFDRTKAEQVIIAGDFKHEFSKNLVDEWVEVKQVLRFIRDRPRVPRYGAARRPARLQSARPRCLCVLVSVSLADPEPHADRRRASDRRRREGRPPRLRSGEPAQVDPRRVAYEVTGRIRTKEILLASLCLLP